MLLVRASLLLLLTLVLVGPAAADSPLIGFDIANAMHHNYYFTNFYVNQTLGYTFDPAEDFLVTHLGAFDMTPSNAPDWDPNYPLQPEDGFKYQHAVALFDRSTMEKLAEVILPAGTGAPIQDEGFRYLPLAQPVQLDHTRRYVVASWFAADGYVNPGMDTFYLMGTSPEEIPSEVYVHPGIEIIDSCFNPNAGDGSTCDPPFVFDMFWGMYTGGANVLLQEAPVPTEETSWGQIKNLYK